jgi:hypothetical protein
MGPFQNFGIAILTLEDENGVIGESPIYQTYNNILETCLLPILFHSSNVTLFQSISPALLVDQK